MLQVKRVYEDPDATDGTRYLIDRLWPRGMSRERLVMEAWLKEVAPSAELRHWFGHDATKWEEFERRYTAELDDNPESWKPIIEASKRGTVTLLYAAHDEDHNNALVLKIYLERHLA